MHMKKVVCRENFNLQLDEISTSQTQYLCRNSYFCNSCTCILFLTTQGHGGPPRMSDHLNAGATSETAQTKDNTHQTHTQSSRQGEYGMMITMVKWYSGTLGPKVSWHLSYRWGKTQKNLTQETCPDRGSNPDSLRDKRACYNLLHSGGPKPCYNDKL